MAQSQRLGHRGRAAIAIGAVGAFTCLSMGGASAATAQASGPGGIRATSQDRPMTGASSCAITRWGHTGYRWCGHGYVDADWDGNGTTDETFVVAPNRTIWHTWKAAGGWKEMPHNGRADGVQNYVRSNHTGIGRVVNVIANGVSYYSSYSQGKWWGWYKGYVPPVG